EHRACTHGLSRDLELEPSDRFVGAQAPPELSAGVAGQHAAAIVAPGFPDLLEIDEGIAAPGRLLEPAGHRPTEPLERLFREAIGTELVRPARSQRAREGAHHLFLC